VAQLVGLPCSICGERIGAAFESAFCEKCGNPVHNRCRRPASSPAGHCPTCGADLAAAGRTAAEREREQREAEARLPPPPPLEAERMLHAYRVARGLLGWILGAVGAVVGGVVVLTLDEPGTTFVGIAAIVAGVAMGVLAVSLARR
jgi:sulfite exporter TauE/SafE